MMKKDDSGIDLGKSPDVFPKKKSSKEKSTGDGEKGSEEGASALVGQDSDSETGQIFSYIFSYR